MKMDSFLSLSTWIYFLFSVLNTVEQKNAIDLSIFEQ